MSTLNVSALKNIGAGFTNLLLNSDGSVTLPVYTNASTPPVQFQAGTLWFNGTNLQIRNSANTAWVAVGGGGGGTVTGVAGTAPIVSSGGSAPTISILPATTGAAGSLSAADKVKIDALPLTIVSSVTGSAPIVVATGTTTPAISINAATTSLPGSVQLADAAASQAGTSATLVSTPAFTVSKDAATMTGAAILPSGTDLQRAAIATPVAGMTRFNTDYTPDSLEVYDGSAWNQVAYVQAKGVLPDLIITANQVLPAGGSYENISIAAGVTVTVPSSCYLYARTSITINGTIDGNGSGYPKGPRNIATSNVGQGAAAPGFGQGLGVTTASGVFYAGGRLYGVGSSFLGSSGMSGYAAVDTGSITSGLGGDAGGTAMFICDGPITVGASAIISVNGQSGTAATFSVSPTSYSAGGGGGGSGGLILLQSNTSLTLTVGSTLSAAGGNGGVGIQGGGSWSWAGGGGGGGGGYIVLNSPSTADASTKTLTGGTGGAGVGAVVSGGYGGGGSGFGGIGGYGGGLGGTTAGGNGGAGQTLLNLYI